jgi:phosphomannomutase
VDDALYAALKMAEIVEKSGSHLSSMVDKIPHYPTLPIKTYDCPDEEKFAVVEIIASRLEGMGYRVSRLDGAKAYTGSGWLLLRASNTMPQIKMSAEADNESELFKLKELGEKLFREAMASVDCSGRDTQRD